MYTTAAAILKIEQEEELRRRHLWELYHTHRGDIPGPPVPPGRISMRKGPL